MVLICLAEEEGMLKFYESLLADRLLKGTSRCIGKEKSLIEYIGEEISDSYALKFKQMLNDMQSSQDFNKEFADWIKSHPNVIPGEQNIPFLI